MSSGSVIAMAPSPGQGDGTRKPSAGSEVAAGLPVDDLPPVIEPTGFDEPAPPEQAGHRPQRRSFLAPVAREAVSPETAPDPAAASEVAPTEAPPSVPPSEAEVAPTSVAPPPPTAVESETPPPAAERGAAAVLPPVPPSSPPAPEAAGPIAPPGASPEPAAGVTPEAAVPPGEVPLATAAEVQPMSGEPQGRLSGWRARMSALLPSGRWRVIAAGIAVVALVAIVYAAGAGRLAGWQHYRETSPPGDPAGRLAYYKAGAQGGDAEAELQLGILYAKGEGIERDYTTAATWFRAAAEQGSARAQYDLGVMYERGRGVPVDLSEAAKWYLKAAEGKHPLAQYNLAVCYTKGQGVRQDLPEAALWYRRAAAQGVVQAMINLGMLYEKGEGVAVSPVDAYAWYSAAGRRDSQPAAQRAREIYAGLPKLDQIRAEALASDVSASIKNPELGELR